MESATSKPDDMPVTMPLVSLAKVLRCAADLYLAEGILARWASLPAPASYWPRCEELFYEKYAAQAEACGLSLNDATFRGLLRDPFPDELLHMSASELPVNWVFNPHSGWRKL